MIPKLYL